MATKIYVKNDDEKRRLQRKYPGIDVEWDILPKEKLEEFGMTPIVCKDNQPIEKCPIGEQHIAKLVEED